MEPMATLVYSRLATRDADSVSTPSDCKITIMSKDCKPKGTAESRVVAWKSVDHLVGMNGSHSDLDSPVNPLELPASIQHMNVPLFSASQRMCALVATAALVATWAYAWAWWLAVHDWGRAMPVMDALVTVLMFNFTWGSLFYTILSQRTQQINPHARPPRGARVAMVVTKAPSEPFEVLQTTLVAMLSQDYGRPYDAWLADEAPTAEVYAWCEQHGVRVSTRHGVPEYHQSSWPRRTKCKEGNLAYFYDNWGYRDYDIVAQFDADHVPAPNYLSACLPAFRDPNVAYVAAPSVCSIGSSRSWACRGRLWLEGPFQGITRAMMYPNLMPVCIGSHYVVRTAHLKSVGGIGPELDEDWSTSALLTAGGYKGVFAFDVAAVGEGPPTFEAAMKQEYQWARSLAILLLEYFPLFWTPKMTVFQKARVLQGCFSYPSDAATLGISLSIATLAAFGHSFGNFTWPLYFLHVLMPGLVYLAYLTWMRANGWLRPINARMISWEQILFAPCATVFQARGVIDGCIGSLTGINFSIQVTPKGGDGAVKIGVASIAPLAAISFYGFTLTLLGPESALYRHVPFFVGLLFLIISILVVCLHYAENHRTCLPWRNLRNHSLILGFVAAVGACAAALHPGVLAKLVQATVAVGNIPLSWDDRAGLSVVAGVVLCAFAVLASGAYAERQPPTYAQLLAAMKFVEQQKFPRDKCSKAALGRLSV